MKSQLRKLNLIFRFTKLKPEMFYAIKFDKWDIVLQGDRTDELELYATKYPQEKGCSYFNCGKHNVRIILT
jgi:hypothetical protein